MRGVTAVCRWGRCPGRTRWVPARAGNTPGGIGITQASGGSSPRVRGTRGARIGLGVHRRLIPARAGNTICSTSPSAGGGGSSPRVRGTPASQHRSQPTHRLIPARAGNTIDECHHARARTAHPRACGEHFKQELLEAIHDGSSPRVRGTRNVPACDRHRIRLIPARAGNTAAPVMPHATTTAHPRACGEHEVAGHGVADKPGSSPRVRGTRLHRQTWAHVERLIPARAGNTWSTATRLRA